MKIIIFYHLKDWYNLSYPVLFNYISIIKNIDIFKKYDMQIIDYKDFLSNDDKTVIDTANKNNKEIDYYAYINKAASNLVDIMRDSDIYDNSILIGFHNAGSDIFFNRKGHCQYDFYDIFKSKNCKFIIWMDDLHGFPNFPKYDNYNENIDYSKCSDYRLDLADKILTPSIYYYKLLNSQYLNKSIFYFYSLNEDWYSKINIDNFKHRKNKILISGAYGNYPLRNLMVQVISNYKSNSDILYKQYITQLNLNINDFTKKFCDMFEILTSPGYDRTQNNFFDKVGLNYLKHISNFKGAFFGYHYKPCNFNLAKIIEILMCGTLGFFEFSPLLEIELGLLAFTHYVPITDKNNIFITDQNYYLYYLNSPEGAQIALNGANYIRREFSSEKRTLQLINILKSL